MKKPQPTKSKVESDYQSAPRGSQRCGLCSMFRRPRGCTLVKGDISPMGWCRYWERKGGNDARNTKTEHA